MKLKNVLIETGLHDARQKLGICRFAKEQNWHLTFDERISLPHGWQGDGVLTILHDRKDLIDYVRHLRIPVVDMGFYHPEIRVARVIGDHQAIGRVAAEHFAHAFFRHAAWFSSSWTHVHALRFDGFQESWLKHASSGSRAPLLRWVWCEQTSKRKFDDWTLFTRWIGKLLREAPKPLAVFAFDDYDAMRIHDACISNDLAIPEEVAILGVDNNEMVCDHQVVPLASVKHDLEEIGYRAAELLGKLMRGRAMPPTKPVLIPPQGIALRRSAETVAVENPMVRHALIYIKENIHRSFGAEQLALHLKVPRSSLDLAFTNTVGHSIGTEILRQRLAQVKLLLLNTPLKIQEIAEQTGFCNASYLNNLFRRAHKQTPLRYRRLHKGVQHDL